MNYKNTAVKKMNFNGQKVKKWYHNGVKVFSAGNIVTYNVDTGTSYQEEVDSEATVLSPKTFTPTKSGWTFIGWRTDKTASSSVLQSKVMGDNPISLYAVFRRTLTLSFANNYASGGSTSPVSGYQYYNNGNVAHPTVTLPNDGYTRSGLTFVKWALGNPGTKVTLTDNTSTKAVCKYLDITPRFSYGTGYWTPDGTMHGGTHTVDGTKYSQIYISSVTTESYSIWVDNNATHSGEEFECKYIFSPSALASQGMLFQMWSGTYDGYAQKYYNGNSHSDGSTEFTMGNITIDIPSNNVNFGGTDLGGNSSLTASGIKYIGRTVS